MAARPRSVLNTAQTRCLPANIELLANHLSLATRCQSINGLGTQGGMSGDGNINGHSAWITVLGVVLAVVSLLILSAIVLLYVQDGRALRHPTINGLNQIRRVPSDMVTLIPKCSNGSCNMAGGESNEAVQRSSSSVADPSPHPPAEQPVTPSRTVRAPPVGGAAQGSEKRVRFAQLPS